jgi:hypothetical protein
VGTLEAIKVKILIMGDEQVLLNSILLVLTSLLIDFFLAESVDSANRVDFRK